MMENPKRSRDGVTAGAAAAALVLAFTALSAIGARPATADISCRARNATLGTAATSDLQAVLDAASAGNRIVITGVCRGNFEAPVSLTLVGQATADVPKAILDGNRTGSVLTGGDLRLRTLIVQNGYALDGAGIDATNLVLNATTVRWNTAAGASEYETNNGGGIWAAGSVTLNMGSRVVHNQVLGPSGYYIYGGGIVSDTLIMNGNALVGWNHSDGEGGGIYSYEAVDVHLRGTSSVRGNTAGWAGGGISADVGTITMSGSSTVTGNAAWDGGGIHGWDVVVLRDSASVVDNTATGEGGGIADTMWVRACAASSPDPWLGAISPNTPDDPPSIHFVNCT